MLDPEKLTEMAQKAVPEAQAIARRNQNNEVETVHLLLALVEQEKGIVGAVLEKMGMTSSLSLIHI